MSLNGWQNLRLTTREKDVLALRLGGADRAETARRLSLPIQAVVGVEEKVKAGFKDKFLNVTGFDRAMKREAVFRRLVNEAMQEMGIEELDDKCEFLRFAIGEDYGTLPYQFWPDRLRERVKLLGVDSGSPVKAVIRAACEIYKQERLIVPVHYAN